MSQFFPVGPINPITSLRRRIASIILNWTRTIEFSQIYCIFPNDLIQLVASFASTYETRWSEDHKGNMIISNHGLDVCCKKKHMSVRARNMIPCDEISIWDISFHEYMNGGYFYGVCSQFTDSFHTDPWESLKDAWGLGDSAYVIHDYWLYVNPRDNTKGCCYVSCERKKKNTIRTSGKNYM